MGCYSSDRVILLVRGGPFPHGLKRLPACLHDPRIVTALLADPAAVAAEEVEQQDGVVEQPKVIQRDGHVQRFMTRKPPDLLPGPHVRERLRVLPPDVVADRLTDDA